MSEIDTLLDEQLPSGGWRHTWPGSADIGSLDNSISQTHTRTLLRAFADRQGDIRLAHGLYRGLQFLRRSQLPTGAWPQYWPLLRDAGKPYHDYSTLNDGATTSAIRVLLEASEAHGGEYLDAALRGCGFLWRAQLASGAWTEQYDAKIQPAWGRPFEPPGASSHCTGQAIIALTHAYRVTGNRRWLEPCKPAAEWLATAQLTPHYWARLYDPETDEPWYGDRTQPHTIITEWDRVSDEEKRLYAWRGEYGIGTALTYYRRAAERAGL